MFGTPASSDKCLFCDYSRKGLVETQDCPECGMPNGPDCWYFRVRRTRGRLIALGLIGLFVVALFTPGVGGHLRAWFSGLSLVLGSCGMPVLILLLTLVYVAWELSAQESAARRTCLAVSPLVLAVVRDGYGVQRFPLARMEDLRIDHAHDTATFRFAGEEMTIAYGRMLSADPSQPIAFANRLLSAWEAARSG